MLMSFDMELWKIFPQQSRDGFGRRLQSRKHAANLEVFRMPPPRFPGSTGSVNLIHSNSAHLVPTTGKHSCRSIRTFTRTAAKPELP